MNEAEFDTFADEYYNLLITARALSRATSGGWAKPSVNYNPFFQHILGALRLLERYLGRVPLSAKNFVVARKP